MTGLTRASVATAWVVIVNKPFYPLYVWWLVGTGVRVSLWTLAALPLFAAIPWVARRSEFASRLGLPLAGAVDTAFSTYVFGQSSGVEAFLIPCAALALVSFARHEARVAQGLALGLFALYALLRFAAPVGVWPWPEAKLGPLVELNLYSAAALTAFVGLRFASARG